MYQRLLQAIEDIGEVHPTKLNANKAAYFPLEQIYHIVRPVMLKHGLVLVSSMTEVIHSTYETRSKTKMDMAEVHAHFRIVNADDPNDFIEATWIAPGSSAGYMATMGAETIAIRSFIEHLFMIGADNYMSNDEPAMRRGRQQSRPPSPPKFHSPDDMRPLGSGGGDALRCYLSEKGLTEAWLRKELKQRGYKHEKIDYPAEMWPRYWRPVIHKIVNEELDPMNQPKEQKEDAKNE